VREATAAEIAELRDPGRGQARRPAAADTSDPRLAMLTRMRAKDVTRYGTKAANLGEIRTANLPGVNIPDGFGVPFFYYVRHMRQHGLDAKVEAMLADARFTSDAAWRKTELEQLRKPPS
jgi:phosphoenolpyruvate synthase/pyruvate phosphate dikinase